MQEDPFEDGLVVLQQILVLDEFLARGHPRPLERRDGWQPVIEEEEQPLLGGDAVQMFPAIAHPVGVELVTELVAEVRRDQDVAQDRG